MIKAMEAGADIVCGESALPPETAWKIRWSRGVAARLLGRKSVPNGIRDPFTGYRAYRVFTVKKAIDSRSGERLLLHDGWSANAELLALTAPNARRVEPLDVTVRPHRLQRPSRLQPWLALKSVWAYARKAVPQLAAATVAELDDLVAAGAITRRSDAAAVRERMSERSDKHGNRSPHGDRQPHNARSERPRNDRSSRSRDNTSRNGNSGTRTRNPRADRLDSGAQNASQNASRPASQTGESRPPRQRRSRNGQRSRAQSEAGTASETAAAAELPAEELTAPDAANATGDQPKRRRRRGRRSRGGAARQTRTAGDSIDDASSDPGAASVVEPAAASENSAPNDAGTAGADGAPAKKRRRGRRGGRGRRRQGAAATLDAGATGDSASGDVGSAESSSAAEPAPQPQPRSHAAEQPAPLAVPVVVPQDRFSGRTDDVA
jgi:hypothetical protein